MSIVIKVQLTLSESVCRRLQEQVFDLESRLEKTTKQTELSKEEAEMNKRALRKCIKEKGEMLGYCKRLTSLLHDLEREYSLYDRYLQRYMESLEENEKDNELISAISRQEHLSEEAKLIAEIEALEKNKQRLLTNLTQAEQEVEFLSQGNKYLDDKLSKLPVNVKSSQQEESTSFNIFLPSFQASQNPTRSGAKPSRTNLKHKQNKRKDMTDL